jgi:hypothetical protein
VAALGDIPPPRAKRLFIEQNIIFARQFAGCSLLTICPAMLIMATV